MALEDFPSDQVKLVGIDWMRNIRAKFCSEMVIILENPILVLSWLCCLQISWAGPYQKAIDIV